MTFYDYIVSLKISHQESQVGIALDLLNYAGAKELPSEDTIKSWLTRSKKAGTIKVPCESRRYFPKLEMDGKKFMDFIKRRIHTDVWKKVQEAFASVVEGGDAVDVHTDDREVFCESLMRHFYLLFGLHLSENYEFKVSTSENNAVAETESVPDPLRQDDNVEPEQIEIAPPQDEEGKEALFVDSEDNDSTVSELLLSVTEPESEPTLSEVPVSETTEEGANAPPYPCEDFMNVVKKYAFDIDIFLKRKVKNIYEDEFKQIQPVMTAFHEILPKLQDKDNKPIYPYPSSVKYFIKAFREYYEFFQEHNLANMTIRDHRIFFVDTETDIILLDKPFRDSLNNGDKFRKAAKKLYSAAKEDAVYAVKRYHEMIE